MMKLNFIVARHCICNVKTPAVSTIRRFEPFFYKRIRIFIDYVAKFLRSVVQCRKRRNVKPGFIGIIRAEKVEFSLRAFRIVERTFRFRKKRSVAVEPAVCNSRMIYGNVKNNANSVFMKFLRQFRKRLISAEMRINVKIIKAVVFMDCCRIKNRIKIYCRYAEFFKIRNFLPYSLKVAAVKIKAVRLLVRFGNGSPVRNLSAFKAVKRIFSVLHVILRISVAEPFRKNLVEHGILHPFRLLKINKQAENA